MRKWRCVKVNNENRHNFTVGKTYETDDNMLNCKIDNGYVLKNVRIIENEDSKIGLIFEEVFEKEEDKKVDKFKVGDKVRIIGNKSSGHKFNIGEVAKIDKIYNEGTDREHYMASNKNKLYYVSYVDIELFNKQTKKTLTITTSDTITTLSDGTHTTSINRYHTDKHDVKVAVNEVVKKYFDEVARANRPTKGKDLIGIEITKGTKFKVINVEPHRDKGYVCLDEYVGKVGSFAKDSFKFTENGYMCSSTFEEDYMNAIDKENGELFWRYDEVEILWED